jgi:alkanesulfonate monooxygenase SsuD/methylene tetrahydromethanopterin reductase-like flavin-dependent oxidoreductase (luciferase family)
MRFSIFTTVHDTGDGNTPDATIDDFREQCVLAEELGYHAVWIGEHHFGPYGVGDLPNPILLGADIAARTSHIRIGQMANIATWWNPIRLAEDIAILDNMTKGRVEAGFGRGIWPYEGPQFHPHADTRLEKENRELFRETVECVQKVWTQEHFSHQGPNYTFPAPGTTFKHPLYPSNPEWQDGDQVTKLRVTPKPYQKPHPPLWATVSTDRSVSMAAKMGLKACYWQPPARRIHERCKVYAEVRGKREGRPYRIGEDQAVLRNTYVAGSMEEAKRDAEEGILSIFQYNDPYRGTQVFLNPGEEVDPGTKLSWDFLEPRALLVGSPEHIIERLEEHQEICGLDEILVGYAHHRVPQKKTLKNLELFATKVMPHFQKGQEAAAE